jgi:hypothetical protein
LGRWRRSLGSLIDHFGSVLGRETAPLAQPARQPIRVWLRCAVALTLPAPALGQTANTYTIGGSVSGLNGNLVLGIAVGNQTVSVPAGTTRYVFPAAMPADTADTVSVKTPVATQTRTVANANATGTIDSANVTSANVICAMCDQTSTVTDNRIEPLTPTTGTVCAAATGGPAQGCCTLRAAIEAANNDLAATPNANVLINFPDPAIGMIASIIPDAQSDNPERRYAGERAQRRGVATTLLHTLSLVNAVSDGTDGGSGYAQGQPFTLTLACPMVDAATTYTWPSALTAGDTASYSVAGNATCTVTTDDAPALASGYT